MKYVVTRITTDAEDKTSITNTIKDTIEEARANLYFQASQIFENLAPSDAAALMDSIGNRIDVVSYVKPQEVVTAEPTSEE